MKRENDWKPVWFLYEPMAACCLRWWWWGRDSRSVGPGNPWKRASKPNKNITTVSPLLPAQSSCPISRIQTLHNRKYEWLQCYHQELSSPVKNNNVYEYLVYCDRRKNVGNFYQCPRPAWWPLASVDCLFPYHMIRCCVRTRPPPPHSMDFESPI